MDPVAVSIIVDKPREEVFEYLADIANHRQFTDHLLDHWHLTREDPYGQGAGARFRVKVPFNRFSWADATFVDVDPPRLIVEAGRAGKFNRIRTLTTYTLAPGPGGTTRVELVTETGQTVLIRRETVEKGRKLVTQNSAPEAAWLLALTRRFADLKM